MAEISAYYVTDAELSAMEYVTDYSAQGLAALVAAERRGATIRAVHDDGSVRRVAASEVSDPNAPRTGSASVGVTYSAAAPTGAGMRLMKAQAAQGDEPWTGTLTICGTTLRFKDGLLVSVSQTEGGSNEITK